MPLSYIKKCFTDWLTEEERFGIKLITIENEITKGQRVNKESRDATTFSCAAAIAQMHLNQFDHCTPSGVIQELKKFPSLLMAHPDFILIFKHWQNNNFFAETC